MKIIMAWIQLTQNKRVLHRGCLGELLSRNLSSSLENLLHSGATGARTCLGSKTGDPAPDSFGGAVKGLFFP
jgi:hypothetical protein